jgi:ribonucleotide reductase beta subunit family protein with ferritin-like domain
MTVFNTNKDIDTTKSPMFFGAPLGVQRYDTYKYPDFDKLTQQQLGFFWRPEEVSLQKDRSDYLLLRPEQKHIFTSNLKYQILLDSVQGRGPGMAFLPYCSLPELEACMTVWEFMEMIHSRSYTYIIKNIYANPSEVFDTILTDEMILERASSVTTSYDDFINSAQNYGSSNIWKFANEGVDLGKDERIELKRKLYRAIVNVNILEGIRFYVSFACSFAFGELKVMEGSAKIISLIARDESCFVKGTEVLTPIGWKKFEDLDKTEKVAQYNSDGSIEFVYPSHYTRKPHNGLVYEFSNTKGHFKQVVTPDHRIIWRDSITKSIKENTAEGFNASPLKQFIASGVKIGGRSELSYIERFKISLQADGSIQDKELRNGKFNGCNTVTFSLTKTRKIDRLDHIIEQLNFRHTKKLVERNGKDAYVYTVWVPIEYDVVKDFSWVNLENISGAWCVEFLKELSNWDGHLRNGDYSDIYFSTTNSDVADTVQSIAALSGRRAHRGIQIDDRKDSCKDVHRITIIEDRDFYCAGVKRDTTSAYTYDGEVFCVTVPSGMLVVRYDNKVIISGNCHLNLTQKILSKWEQGDDPEMVQITKEEVPYVYSMFDVAVNEEKRWAQYLFKDGSMIGLNDKLLFNYVEWIANRRLKSIGLKSVYDISAKNNPLPWTSHWLNSKLVQTANMETENESYVVGGIKQDMKSNAFSEFKL